MLRQRAYNQCRITHLKTYFQNEFNLYHQELSKSEDPEQKAIFQLILDGQWDQELVDIFLSLYIDRCKYQHAL